MPDQEQPPTEVQPRRYPVPRPAPGEIDPRMTYGLIIDVGKVLAEHGYPELRSGADAVELDMTLRAFLYGKMTPDEVAAAVAEFEKETGRAPAGDVGAAYDTAARASGHPAGQRDDCQDPGLTAALLADDADRPTITFARGVRCGGCGEILPDQEGIARDCECIRIELIECRCPDAFLDNGMAVDDCPRCGTQAPANQDAAAVRGPWYGQPVEVARG